MSVHKSLQVYVRSDFLAKNQNLDVFFRLFFVIYACKVRKNNHFINFFVEKFPKFNNLSYLCT